MESPFAKNRHLRHEPAPELEVQLSMRHRMAETHGELIVQRARRFLLTGALLAAPVLAFAATTIDQPINCSDCAEWNEAAGPFKIFGNTYYVGVRGLSSILVSTSAGLILLDAALPQSATLVEDSIRTLGFKVEDIKLILNSHAHFDHAGGIARIQRDSGAEVLASEAGARAIQAGELQPEDPQFGLDPSAFPKVERVRTVRDGEVIRLGDTELTAHMTPGHTAGSTTWTWQACEDTQCLAVVYADSLTAVSAPDFRFLGDADHADLSATFRATFAKVEALPCDILLTVHPGFSKILDKRASREAGQTNPFRDPDACRAYAAQARKNLEERLAKERSPKP